MECMAITRKVEPKVVEREYWRILRDNLREYLCNSSNSIHKL